MTGSSPRSLLIEELSTVQIRDLLATGWDTVIHVVSSNGVLGDQRPPDAERGRFYFDTLGRYLAADLAGARTSTKEGTAP